MKSVCPLMPRSHRPVDEVPMGQRCNFRQFSPNAGRTPVVTVRRLGFKAASVDSSANFNFEVKIRRRSPILTTSEYASADVRPSIGRCPCIGGQNFVNRHRPNIGRSPTDVGPSLGKYSTGG